jgi:dihydroorotate dehydrogenase
MLSLYPYMDYFEVNISCPNQAWVCSLQSEVGNILEELTKYNNKLAEKFWTTKKLLFVKISPLTQNPQNPEDWTIEWLKNLASIFNKYKWKWLDWVIATNTAKEHSHKEKTKIKTPNWWIITWWASWKQIQEISLKTVKKLREFLDKEIPIIWVWWIWYDEKWKEWQSWVNMLKAWAISLQILSSFVQNWTIMVVRDLKKAILESREKF